MSLDRIVDQLGIEGPVVEFFGWDVVSRLGGTAILPWRDQWLEARRMGVACAGTVYELEENGIPRFSSAVVHLQKSRKATEDAFWRAWHLVPDGGSVVLVGPNRLGIRSAVERMAAKLSSEPVRVAYASKSRAAVFIRSGEGELPDPPSRFRVHVGDLDLEIESWPGLFSESGLDMGTKLLLEEVIKRDPPEGLVVDAGCGTGVVGVVAGLVWGSPLLFVDLDARAVACSATNASRFGLGEWRTAWWDAVEEDPPWRGASMVLINPPFHSRSSPSVDLLPMRALLLKSASGLRARGSMLVVSLESLPVEPVLRGLGELRLIRSAGGYKLLEFVNVKSKLRRALQARRGV